MKRVALPLVVVAVLATASTASASIGARLDRSMQAYAVCRAPSGTTVAGGISSAYKGAYVRDVLMSNGAQLIVRYGQTRHAVVWISRHDVTTLLFRFRHVRNVPRRLDAAC